MADISYALRVAVQVSKQLRTNTAATGARMYSTMQWNLGLYIVNCDKGNVLIFTFMQLVLDVYK